MSIVDYVLYMKCGSECERRLPIPCTHTVGFSFWDLHLAPFWGVWPKMQLPVHFSVFCSFVVLLLAHSHVS